MIYNYIKQIDTKSLFLYIIILIICLFYFHGKNITLGTIFGILTGVVVISYIISKKAVTLTNEDVQHDLKLKAIHPTSKYIGEFRELTDFVFSVQDMYMYNPPAFEEMIINIDKFFKIYKEVLIDPSMAGIEFSILNKFKYNAINALHSIIFTLPANKQLVSKHEEAYKTLEKLINVYMNKIYRINIANIQKFGYRTNTVILNTVDLPAIPINTYDKNIFTYEFI